MIRREILLDEGDMFNTNSLGFQHPAAESAWILRGVEEGRCGRHHAEPETEHRRSYAQGEGARQELDRPNGGVSGIAGSFVGFNYSTNNFLGLGETLSLSSQLGTRMRDV